MKSQLTPIIKVAEMFNRHTAGIVNAMCLNKSNAMAERLNGKIQEIKLSAKGTLCETPVCHSERSEESLLSERIKMFRFAQHDKKGGFAKGSKGYRSFENFRAAILFYHGKLGVIVKI